MIEPQTLKGGKASQDGGEMNYLKPGEADRFTVGAISSRGIPLLRVSEASIGETSDSDDASAVCAEIQASLGNRA